MAIFGWKKSEPDKPKDAAKDAGAGGAGGGGGGGQGISFSPDRAHRFFERANTLHEATSYEYAMSMWLSGLRQDPTSMAGLEGFFKSAGAYMNSGAKGVSKDVAKEFPGKNELEKYLRSILEWSAKPTDAASAVKAVEGATVLGLADAAFWIAQRALPIARNDKRAKKEHLLTVMESMRKFERFETAVEAGEWALRLDPADAKLGALIRNISAESTMTKGGFDQQGKEGGFRTNIRDAGKQQQMEDEQRMDRSEEAQARLVNAARADYEVNKLDRPNTMRYIQRLLERGTPEDQQTAYGIAIEAHKSTQEYRFLEEAERIRLRQARARVAKLKQAAEAPEAGDEAKRAFRLAAREYVEAEAQALESQVKAYPTDLGRKFELGKRYFQLGRFEDAIGQLQEAKADSKNRSGILHLLGLAFTQIGWLDEAVETHRQALENHTDHKDAQGMELRYGLLTALAARGVEQSDLGNAEEAYKIASSIAIEQINFKDIRARREELKGLITRLKGGAAT